MFFPICMGGVMFCTVFFAVCFLFVVFIVVFAVCAFLFGRSIVFTDCALFMVFLMVSAVSPLLAVVRRVRIAAGIVVVISARMAMRPNRRCKTA